MDTFPSPQLSTFVNSSGSRMFNSAYLYDPNKTMEQKVAIRKKMEEQGFGYSGYPMQERYASVGPVRVIQQMNSRLFWSNQTR